MENEDTWIELSAVTRNVVMWLALIGIADRDRGLTRSAKEEDEAAHRTSARTQSEAAQR